MRTDQPTRCASLAFLGAALFLFTGCADDGTGIARQDDIDSRIDARTASAEERANRRLRQPEERVNQRVDGTVDQADEKVGRTLDRGLDRLLGDN